MKRFKARKKMHSSIIYLGLFLVAVALSIRYLYLHNQINDNTIVSRLVNDNLGIYKKNFTDIDFLLKYALNLDLQKEEKLEIPAMKEENTQKEEEIPSEETPEEVQVPLVYIYNSHQEEKYQNKKTEPYNIDMTVYTASQMLKEYLEDLGIMTIVEDNNVANRLKELNLKYGSSYKVSREFMENASQNNPTLKYFIDLHRDSSKYENTTSTIDGIVYAKVLFVVGLDNPNYEPNLALVTRLRGKIEAYNPTLMRGIMKKSGKGVNGVYNQDFSPNTMLIEVGGQYNYIDEVNNTLKVLAPLIKELIEEDMK